MAAIRLAEARDAERVASVYAPYVTDSTISFEREAPDASEMERRIASTLAHAPWLVLVGDGDLAGFAYASRHRERAAYDWSVDVSVYVDPARRRAGIGRALYTSLLALLPLQGFCVAHAGIALPNAASVGLHESSGFRPVGVYSAVGFKRGAWHDVGWWRRPLRDLPSEPGRIKRLDEVRTTPEWERALAGGLDVLGSGRVGRASELDDEALWAAVSTSSLPHDQWNHRTHIRVAWLHLRRYELEEAHLRMRAAILRLNAFHRLVESPARGYHETMTRAWLVLVGTQMKSLDHETSLDFVDGAGDRLGRDAVLRHYSRDRIMSVRARATFLEPDVAPFGAD